jgi:hypothetical protein
MEIKRVSTAVIVIIIWLVTAALGIWEIVIVRELFFRFVASFRAVGISGYQAIRQSSAASSVGILLILVLAIVWVAAFLGGVEYHRRHLGQPGSWKLITCTMAAELSILLLVLFV